MISFFTASIDPNVMRIGNIIRIFFASFRVFVVSIRIEQE